MGRVTEKIITTVSAGGANGSATGWISLNTHQENFNASYAIKKVEASDGPVLRVDGTLVDVLSTATVANADYFTIGCAAATSATGTLLAEGISFPVAAVRLRNVSGGSGQTTLSFRVLQTGKH